MKKVDHHLIQQVLEGVLSPQAFAEFQQRMRSEPDMAKLYSEYALLHHTLSEELEHESLDGPLAPVSRFTPALKGVLLALAALLAVVAVWFFANSRFKAEPSFPVARATFSMDAVWQITGSAADPTRLVEGSVLNLQQGQVRIDLGPYAHAVLEGPSQVKIQSALSLHLAEGSGRFSVRQGSQKFQVSTPAFTAEVLGTVFGVEAFPGRPGTLHVMDGKVEMRTLSAASGTVLAAGEAASVSDAGKVERFAAVDGLFLKSPNQFRPVFGGPLAKADWRIPYGSPLLADGGISGENFSAFCKLPQAEPAEENSVFLATLETGVPISGEFHTDGWSGMSLFHGGVEMMFFGDSFGMERTWSLDLKQRNPVIMPELKVTGPRSVTLRYDKKTGDVTLHDGRFPLKPPFCKGKFPPGVVFDEIRLAASSGAALDVRSLTIQVGRVSN